MRILIDRYLADPLSVLMSACYEPVQIVNRKKKIVAIISTPSGLKKGKK